MECIEYINASELRRCPSAGGQLVQHFALLFELSFGEGGGLLKSFLDAARSRLRSAVIEDPEQVAAALQKSHGLPAEIGARIAGERESYDGGQVQFGFRGGEQHC